MKLENKYCIFIDILGAKEKIMNINTEEEFIEKIVLLRRKIEEIFPDKEIEKVTFSDNVFITAADGTELQDLIKNLAMLQLKAIELGLFIRGGITKGDIYINKKLNMVIGRGLIRAYELESTGTFYPVISVDEEGIGGVEENKDFCKRHNIGEVELDFLEEFNPKLLYSFIECFKTNYKIFSNIKFTKKLNLYSISELDKVASYLTDRDEVKNSGKKFIDYLSYLICDEFILYKIDEKENILKKFLLYNQIDFLKTHKEKIDEEIERIISSKIPDNRILEKYYFLMIYQNIFILKNIKQLIPLYEKKWKLEKFGDISEEILEDIIKQLGLKHEDFSKLKVNI